MLCVPILFSDLVHCQMELMKIEVGLKGDMKTDRE